MARARRPLLLPAVLLLLLAAAFLAMAWKMGDPLSLAIFTAKKSSASWSVLEGIRNLEELETASYDMKVVFPYDFIHDEVDWWELKLEYDRAPERFLEKADPARHPGGRLPPAWEYAELYDQCRRAGIDPGRRDYRFLVLSVAVSAGVDLEEWMENLAINEDGTVEGIIISESDEGVRSLELPAPPIQVVSFTVEDRDSTAEGFPDVPLSPEEWSILVESLEPRLREMALDGGLLGKADQEGRAFLREIFTAAGYDNVEFL